MTKRPRGRPPAGGRSVPVTVNLTRGQVEWLDAQGRPRSEVIADLVEIAVAGCETIAAAADQSGTKKEGLPKEAVRSL